MNATVWIVGAGKMAGEYAKALINLGERFRVIGRDEGSAARLESSLPLVVTRGGLKLALENEKAPDVAIIATQVSELVPAAELLVNQGAEKVLVEKPVALDAGRVSYLKDLCERRGAEVWVAYNRRFYPSVREATDILEADGGLTSLRFEFTEFAQFRGDDFERNELLRKWVVANSSHVLDLAFHFLGEPQALECTVSGSLDWHSSGSIFAGHGLGATGVPFSYLSDWSSGGRWSIEMRSRSVHLQLHPLESLWAVDWQTGGRTEVLPTRSEPAGLKTGIYGMVQAFLSGDESNLCSLRRHAKMMTIYERIAGYER